MESIGGYGWDLGPVIIGDAALRQSFERALTRDEATALVAIEGDAVVTELAGHPAIVLSRGNSTEVTKLDDKSAVFVRFLDWGDARLDSAEDVSPWWIDDDAWTTCEQTFTVRGELQAFDAMARGLASAEDGSDEDESAEDESEEERGKEFLQLELEPGEYLVESATFEAPTGDKLAFVRLRRRGHQPVRPAVVRPIPQVKCLECSAETMERATTLKFVGHGDGGPTVILPNAVRDRWKGVQAGVDGEGTHYDLACGSEETFEFAGHDAFCLQEVGATAALPVQEGLLLPRWVGADSKAGVLAAALAATYQPMYRDGKPLVFESQGGRFTLMHAVEDGGAPETWDWDAIEFEIPAGTYAVEQMDIDGGIEWTGLIGFPDGESEDSMVQAYRLRLL